MAKKYPNNLEKVRKRAGLTQAQLAEQLGCSTQAIQNYEYGLRDMRSSVLKNLAKAMNTTVDVILGISETDADGIDIESGRMSGIPATKTVPVVGRIAAGDPREAFEDVEERWYVPDSIYEEHPRAFYLTVSGDSMDRLLPEGSLVLIDPEAEVRSGDLAAVLVNGFDATLKRIYFAGDTIVLHPESHNPEHHDRTIDRTDPDAPYFRVIGKCITYTAPEGWRA